MDIDKESQKEINNLMEIHEQCTPIFIEIINYIEKNPLEKRYYGKDLESVIDRFGWIMAYLKVEDKNKLKRRHLIALAAETIQCLDKYCKE